MEQEKKQEPEQEKKEVNNSEFSERIEKLLNKWEQAQAENKTKVTKEQEQELKEAIDEREKSFFKRTIESEYIKNNGIKEGFELFFKENKEKFYNSNNFDLTIKELMKQHRYFFKTPEQELKAQQPEKKNNKVLHGKNGYYI